VIQLRAHLEDHHFLYLGAHRHHYALHDAVLAHRHHYALHDAVLAHRHHYALHDAVLVQHLHCALRDAALVHHHFDHYVLHDVLPLHLRYVPDDDTTIRLPGRLVFLFRRRCRASHHFRFQTNLFLVLSPLAYKPLQWILMANRVLVHMGLNTESLIRREQSKCGFREETSANPPPNPAAVR